jgi:hypothetical protein
MVLVNAGQIHAFGEVLTQQSVGLFVGASLPRSARVTKVDFDISTQRETLVIGYFFAPVPGQRLVQLPRTFMRLFNQRADDCLGISALNSNQHAVARVAFYEGSDLAVIAADQQITFPVSRYRTILYLSGTLTNRNRIPDMLLLLREAARMAHHPILSQMRQQLLLQRPTGLNEQRPVNRFV